RVSLPLTALLTTLLAGVAAPPVGASAPTVALSALVVLLPGLGLTTALSELAVGHLVSGTARFSGAVMALVQLGLGVALGQRLLGALPAAGAACEAPLPDGSVWAATLLAGAAFAGLLRSRPVDAGWIVAAGLVAMAGARLGAGWLGPELGAGLGAFVVALGAN